MERLTLSGKLSTQLTMVARAQLMDAARPSLIESGKRMTVVPLRISMCDA